MVPSLHTVTRTSQLVMVNISAYQRDDKIITIHVLYILLQLVCTRNHGSTLVFKNVKMIIYLTDFNYRIYLYRSPGVYFLQMIFDMAFK